MKSKSAPDQPSARQKESKERIERLRKQCAILPGRLAIVDPELIRLLAAAGRGGDY